MPLLCKMKFLSWMQSKLQGKVQFQNKASHSFPSTKQSEETSPSLPLGLLAIGTFGNNEIKVKTDAENDIANDKSTEIEAEDCSLEDMSKLEAELREILQQSSQIGEEEIDGFDYNQTEEDVKKKIGLVIGDWKGDEEKSNRKSIVKRSVSFLVKKMFVCGSHFTISSPPIPNFMEAPQDATIKKILKMMLHKKIYPKNSSQMASLKRFIKEKERRDQRNEDKESNGHDNCNVN